MDFQELVEHAPEVHFVPSMSASHPHIHIGDIHLADSHGMMVLGVSAKLLTEKMAVTVPSANFLTYYEKLFTNQIERWNNNSRSGLKKPEDVMMVGSIERSTLMTFDEGGVSSIGTGFRKELDKKIRDWQVRNDDSASEPSVPEDYASCKDSWGNSTISDSESCLETRINKLQAQSLDWSKIELDDTVTVAERSEIKPRRIFMLPAGAQMIPQIHKPRNERKKIYKTFSQDTSMVDDGNLISVSEAGSISAVDDQQQN